MRPADNTVDRRQFRRPPHRRQFHCQAKQRAGKRGKGEPGSRSLKEQGALPDAGDLFGRSPRGRHKNVQKMIIRLCS